MPKSSSSPPSRHAARFESPAACDLRDMPGDDEMLEKQQQSKAEGEGSESRTTSSNPAPPPPDKGAAAIACVIGGFCLLFVSFGWITCIGIFQDYYQTHQLSKYSPSTVAWIPSLETCIMFIWGPIVGKLFDNYGPRWLVLFGSLAHVFGLMMLSLCTQYYQFILAQSICSATGASFLFFAALTAVSTWFSRHRALALGITVAGSSFGGVVFPIMVQRLNAEVGFGWSIRICAFLILALCVVANLTVTSRVSHKPKPLILDDYWKPLKELPFGLFTFGYFLFYLGFFIPYNFIILQAERYGMSSNLAPYMIPVLNAGGQVSSAFNHGSEAYRSCSCLGRIAPSWLADRLGRFNIMILVTFFSGIVVLALWIPGNDNGAIIAFCVLYGFGSGAFISLAPAILAQISPLPQLGARQGTCFAFIAIASLISNPIAGALVPNTSVDPYWKLQLFAGMMMIGGGVAITIARIAAGGVSLTKVV